MILQALVSYYEDLVKKGEIAPPGWGKNKVTFALNLDDQGQIIQVISQKLMARLVAISKSSGWLIPRMAERSSKAIGQTFPLAFLPLPSA